jgi:hypothetical protein
LDADVDAVDPERRGVATGEELERVISSVLRGQLIASNE